MTEILAAPVAASVRPECCAWPVPADDLVPPETLAVRAPVVCAVVGVELPTCCVKGFFPAKWLKEKKELFSRCLAEKLLTYALGRGLEFHDRRTVDKIVSALEKDGFKFSTLVVEIVKSDPFRLRRGKDQ